MLLLPKSVRWFTLTLIEWGAGLLVFAGAFNLLAHVLPYWTPNSESPTQPFFQVAGYLLLALMGLLNALLLFTQTTAVFLRRLVRILCAGILLFLPVRELLRALYSASTSDRLDWSTGEPVARGYGEWLAGRVQLASEQYAVPVLALALALGVALLIQQGLGRRNRRRALQTA